MLLAYFQIMVFESFASMMIEVLRTMAAATMLRSKNAEPTIILMEQARRYGASRLCGTAKKRPEPRCRQLQWRHRHQYWPSGRSGAFNLAQYTRCYRASAYNG